MDEKKVKDLMIRLDEYPVVEMDATLYDVVKALDEGQKRLPPGRMPYRAVLIVDKHRKIVGKIGQMAFLTALEPRYNLVKDKDKLKTAGLSPELVSRVMDHSRFFEENLSDLCRRRGSMSVQDAMHPVTESVDEDAPLSDAIHKIIMWQQLSLLVTREDEAVGLIRLSDLYDEVAKQIKSRKSE